MNSSSQLVDWMQHAWPQARGDAPDATAGAALRALVRRAILEGVVPPGARLPSSRALAAALGLARNTVVPVYEQLEAEGYVVAGRGSGTYACRIAPDMLRAPAMEGTAPRTDHRGAPPRLSVRGARYRSDPVHAFWTRQPFCPGQIDVHLFPLKTWNRLQHRLLRQLDRAQLDAGEPGGAPALRDAIAGHLRATRGVRCRPEQIILSDGTAESIDLVARLMCNPGDTAIIEDPGYWTATHVLAGHGLRLDPRPVDAHGLPVPSMRRGAPVPRLVYLTPSNQFPTGGVMPLARRLAWLHYAAEHGTLLLEDDYDSEYRYEGSPFPSLQGLDTAGRVIYLGTFSKTIYPGVRIAYVVVPQGLEHVFAEASADFYGDGDHFVQLVLAAFIHEGHYRAHVRNLRREYAARRGALLHALQEELRPQMADGRLRISSGARGVYVTLALPAWVDDRAVARAAISGGVTAIPLSMYTQRVDWRGLILSFAATSAMQIPMLVERLAAALRPALDGAGTIAQTAPAASGSSRASAA